MSVLFEVRDKFVVPRAETLLTPPFKQIWERDTDPNKDTAIKEFTYIEFMTSHMKSNPYRGYPEKEKPIKIIEECVPIPGWKPDELVEQGMEKIVDFHINASVTYRYYISAKAGAEKMMDFFDTFDMESVNLKTGNPVYKPRDITSALNDTSKILQNLNELKKKVEEELFESTKNKGDKEISYFATRESMV